MSSPKFEKRIVRCWTELGLKMEMTHKYTTVGKEQWIRLDADVTVFNNNYT